jgi:hypothetical protein
MALISVHQAPLLLAQFVFAALRHCESSVAHGLDVECDIEMEEVCQGIDGQPI